MESRKIAIWDGDGILHNRRVDMFTDIHSGYLDVFSHSTHARPEDDSDTRFGVRCAGPVNGIRQADGL